jgi:hypothetical protein
LDLLPCPFPLLFAAFWSWQLTFQLYFATFWSANLSFYLGKNVQRFGARTVHVAWFFATRV